MSRCSRWTSKGYRPDGAAREHGPETFGLRPRQRLLGLLDAAAPWPTRRWPVAERGGIARVGDADRRQPALGPILTADAETCDLRRLQPRKARDAARAERSIVKDNINFLNIPPLGWHLLEARLGTAKPGSWVVLDEIQKIPELLDEVHRLMEERRRPRFAPVSPRLRIGVSSTRSGTGPGAPGPCRRRTRR